MNDLNIGFIGGGNMARAMIAGLLRAGLKPTSISVGEPLAALRERLNQDFDVRVTDDNAAVAANADALVLAVKPQELRSVLSALRPQLASRRPLLVSIAAGIRMTALAQWSLDCPIVRAMPNRGALLGAGATAACAAAGVSAVQRALAAQILNATGLVLWVPDEAQLDAVTALSGSGPAYFFLLAEHMASAGTALGLDAVTAQALAAATLHGAGLLAHADPDLTAQRSAVTSKGGTTEAALAVFKDANLAGTVNAAMRAAAERSEQLARANT